MQNFSLKTLSDCAEAGPWEYRPREHDDWGIIRGSAKIFDDGGAGPPVAVSKPVWSEGGYDFDAHRSAGTDPMEANGRFIVELVNAYRDGRLVEVTKEES